MGIIGRKWFGRTAACIWFTVPLWTLDALPCTLPSWVFLHTCLHSVMIMIPLVKLVAVTEYPLPLKHSSGQTSCLVIPYCYSAYHLLPHKHPSLFTLATSHFQNVCCQGASLPSPCFFNFSNFLRVLISYKLEMVSNLGLLGDQLCSLS